MHGYCSFESDIESVVGGLDISPFLGCFLIFHGAGVNIVVRREIDCAAGWRIRAFRFQYGKAKCLWGRIAEVWVGCLNSLRDMGIENIDFNISSKHVWFYWWPFDEVDRRDPAVERRLMEIISAVADETADCLAKA